MLKIFIKDLVCEAWIGSYDHEKIAPQRLLINIEVALKTAPRDDDLATAYDYDAARAIVHKHIATHHNLLETLAQKISADIMADTRVENVNITIEKPNAHADCVVGVTLNHTT